MALTAEDIAYLRLLIGDTSTNPTEQLFSNADLEVMVVREGGLKLAAAQLLDRVAGSELLISKKIRTQDLETDGAAIAKELRAMAAELRRQAREEATTEVGWGIATFTFADPPVWRPEATEYRY